MQRKKAVSVLKSKKAASLCGYTSIFVSTVLNLVLTRMYLRYLGKDGYGLYQMIYSIALYVLVLDMGISTVMVRYLSEYRSKGDKESAEKFAFHIIVLITGILFLLIIGGTILNASIERIYPNLSASDYDVSHRMFIFMIGSLCLTVVQHFFYGVINAHELFVVGNLSSIIASVLKFTIVYLLLSKGIGAIAIAWSDFAVKLFVVILAAYISFAKLRFRVRIHTLNFKLLAGVFALMGGMLLHSISAFANNAIDKTILGIIMTKADVAVYAVAMPFISVFNMLPTVFTNLFLPTAVRLKNHGAGGAEYTDLIVKVGRYQFAICGLMLVGFLICGKDFISLMYGGDVMKAWAIAIIIMVPSMIQLSEEALNGVIDANDKRLFFSSMVLVMSIMNIILTVVLVKMIGILGAPIATGISYITYFIVVRNVFAKKLFGIQISRMIKEIPARTITCLLVAAVPGIILNGLFPGKHSVFLFVVKVVATCGCYIFAMLRHGFSEGERKYVLGILSRK